MSAERVRRTEFDRAAEKAALARESVPTLTLIEGGQRRYLAFMVAAIAMASLMFVVVAGRAHMAEQQLRLDKLNSDIRRARNHFDQLRAERADLLSPENLIAQARAMGMVPSLGNRVVAVSPEVAAEVAATVGKIDDDIANRISSPLDEFGRIKATVGEG